MAKQPTGITRESILQDIYDSINRGQSYNQQASTAGQGSFGNPNPGLGFRNAASQEADRQNQLKYLLNAGFNTGGFGADASGGGGGYVNPFGTGGAGGSGAPTVDNSNRFEAGLSDTEMRLRALLDNPDSINQSAAYKFRVGQGQEAINRQLGAKGMLNSGNRLMELTKYGQDMASQEYDAQAGRLGSLLGNYSGSWLGDKNANTSRFSAEANAWNQAQGNADTNRYRMASLAWDKQKGGGGIVRSSGGMNMSNFNPGGMGGSPDWAMHDRLIAKADAERAALDRY